ncbi:chemotaxis protein CheC [Paenibacillus alvei]|uniref:Signal terminating phosphatase of CheR-mediated methylation of methyl-accepting chemotaxis proteins (MCPs) n=1 Tax=Paenibacillus alvei TaxID=44250 RepID=A0A383R7Q1_PAEAL|nr:chemotaxis protein CheC [Paenibacillus alvei]SYX82823.1 signal terminating phosphatase of CheR-mediated methylation of methyl-accepting chemotaxis proteins (MCPs) [Paenibacillus alvei]
MHLFERLGEFKLDVLKEVGNIGAGNAATALSRLLNRPIDMAVPKVRLLPFEEIADEVGGAEHVVIAIYFRVEGDAPSHLFFMFDTDAAKRLLSHLEALPSDTSQCFNDMELSALSEIGNILAGSYLSSLADFTHMAMSPTVPQLAIDMAGAVLNYGIMQYGEMGDSALLIDTKFLQDCDEVQGTFFLIPDPDSFDKIFAALGVPFE